MNEIVLEILKDVPSVATLIGIIISIRMSQRNHAVISRVEQNTNSLAAKADSDATARGVASGQAAGIVTGIAIGAEQERGRAAIEAEKQPPV